MKKIFSVFMVAVCCLAMAMPAQAQLIKWGVKGGLNMSKLDMKNIGDSEKTTGFFIGPMAEVTIPVIGLGIDGALMYSQRGDSYSVAVEGEGALVDAKQQGVEIPINLKYTFGLGSILGIYVAAGPDFFFNFKDIKVDGVKVDTEKTQVGLNLGAGVKLIKHLQIGVNYQIPMGDSFSVKDGAENLFSSKTKTWQVSLAYTF